MLNIIAGALMMAGGGLLSVASFNIAHAPVRWRAAAEFGDGLAAALADTTSAPIPGDMQLLLDELR